MDTSNEKPLSPTATDSFDMKPTYKIGSGEISQSRQASRMSTIEYRSHCKNCGVKLEKSIINYGRVYCSRKCRVEVTVELAQPAVKTEKLRAGSTTKEIILTDLLAEVGQLLNAIKARDGTAYYNARYTGGFEQEYISTEEFSILVKKIRDAVGGDILKSFWDAQTRSHNP